MFKCKPDIPVGTTFNRLRVLKKIKVEGESLSHYLCECDCGSIKTIPRNSLVTGHTQSCGCLNIERVFKKPGIRGLTRLWNICKYNAKTRNLSFELTFEQHNNIIEQSCFYCGKEPSDKNPYLKKDGFPHKSKKQRKQETIDRAWVKANTIDRIDSTKGYFMENCVPCCAQCNTAKMDYTQEEFIEHANKITKFQEKKKNETL